GWRSARAGGARRPLPGQAEPYESGVWPIGSARERVPIRYYLIAMLFLLFDVEAVFLYPWAVVARELKVYGLVAMLAFVAVLGLGFLYVWKRGALEWQSHVRQSAAPWFLARGRRQRRPRPISGPWKATSSQQRWIEWCHGPGGTRCGRRSLAWPAARSK